MNKRTLTIAILCALVLLYLAIMVGRPSAPGAAVAEASDVTPSAKDEPVAAVQAAKPAFMHAQSEPSASQPTAALTPDERETLVMYDEMQAAFEQFDSDCLRMGEAIDTTVTAHTAALIRLRDQRDRLSYDEQVQALRRVEAAEGPHLDQLRRAMEQAVAKCKHDLTLRDALRRLGKLNAPRDAQPTK